MKASPLTVCFFLLFLSPAVVWGQGTVSFNTRVPAAGIFAPVLLADGTPATGPQYVAVFLAGSTASSLAPIGTPVPLRDSNTPVPGYVSGGTKTIPNIQPGGPAFVAFAAWDSFRYNSYEQARQGGAGFAQSGTIYLEKTGNPLALPPDVPVDMRGLEVINGQIGGPVTLQGFGIPLSAVPEPAPIALLAVGLGLLARSLRPKLSRKSPSNF
jgi:hypothetical protein